MIYHRRTPRLYARLGCLVPAILLACPTPFWIYHSKIVVQASPFVTICALLANGTLGIGSILGLGFSIAVMVRKRWFCRYICPVGLILDGVSNIGFHRNSWWKRCPSIGRYIVFITAAGSVIGYPLLLWMDPLVLLNNTFSIYTATGVITGVLSAAGLTTLLLLTITSGGLWCARVCPLGATQDILADIGPFIGNFKKGSKTKTSRNTVAKYSFPVTRRTLLAIAAGIGLGLLAEKNTRARTENTVLRPPGAIGEGEFTGQCVRCGNCMRACPSKIIRPDIGQTGIPGFMAPVVSYKKGYCLEDCCDCTNVCPSGALKKLPLDIKHKYIIGEALLNPSLCFLVRGVNDCDICVRSCPFDAVQVYWDEEAYVAYPVVDPLKCNGCGACELFCPTGEVKAIRVLSKVMI
jgi:MauM/NapG family ferredoxin protein